jgi:hypothetical protein
MPSARPDAGGHCAYAAVNGFFNAETAEISKARRESNSASGLFVQSHLFFSEPAEPFAVKWINLFRGVILPAFQRV